MLSTRAVVSDMRFNSSEVSLPLTVVTTRLSTFLFLAIQPPMLRSLISIGPELPDPHAVLERAALGRAAFLAREQLGRAVRCR